MKINYIYLCEIKKNLTQHFISFKQKKVIFLNNCIIKLAKFKHIFLVSKKKFFGTIILFKNI